MESEIGNTSSMSLAYFASFVRLTGVDFACCQYVPLFSVPFDSLYSLSLFLFFSTFPLSHSHST